MISFFYFFLLLLFSSSSKFICFYIIIFYQYGINSSKYVVGNIDIVRSFSSYIFIYAKRVIIIWISEWTNSLVVCQRNETWNLSTVLYNFKFKSFKKGKTTQENKKRSNLIYRIT